jgi:hypothetical protein
MTRECVISIRTAIRGPFVEGLAIARNRSTSLAVGWIPDSLATLGFRDDGPSVWRSLHHNTEAHYALGMAAG